MMLLNRILENTKNDARGIAITNKITVVMAASLNVNAIVCKNSASMMPSQQ
jgi:hypothetical protein